MGDRDAYPIGGNASTPVVEHFLLEFSLDQLILMMWTVATESGPLIYHVFECTCGSDSDNKEGPPEFSRNSNCFFHTRHGPQESGKCDCEGTQCYPIAPESPVSSKGSTPMVSNSALTSATAGSRARASTERSTTLTPSRSPRRNG